MASVVKCWRQKPPNFAFAGSCIQRTFHLVFGCVHNSSDSQCFQWSRQPRIIASHPLGMWTPSNTWFSWPTRVYRSISISIGSVFAGLTNVTNRQTHIPRYSICSNRPHLAVAVMWRNSIRKPSFEIVSTTVVYNVIVLSYNLTFDHFCNIFLLLS